VEQAARRGEAGELVRSWLGRTCPPAPAEPMPASHARSRGRFTRNFVIQATAAEWALALLADLRLRLAATPSRIVFFQHDEVLVHAPAERAAEVVAALQAAAVHAGVLLFGSGPVRFPLDIRVVRCYADA
jgi:DNA polymerase-1